MGKAKQLNSLLFHCDSLQVWFTAVQSFSIPLPFYADLDCSPACQCSSAATMGKVMHLNSLPIYSPAFLRLSILLQFAACLIPSDSLLILSTAVLCSSRLCYSVPLRVNALLRYSPAILLHSDQRNSFPFRLVFISAVTAP